MHAKERADDLASEPCGPFVNGPIEMVISEGHSLLSG